MESIIKNIYENKISPEKEIFMGSGEFREAEKKCTDACEAIVKKWPKEVQIQYESIKEYFMSLNHTTGRLFFTEGFRLGGQLTIEILSTPNKGQKSK